LEVFFYAAAGSVRLGSALDGAGVDSDLLDAVEVEWDASVGAQGAAVESYGRVMPRTTVDCVGILELLHKHGMFSGG